MTDPSTSGAGTSGAPDPILSRVLGRVPSGVFILTAGDGAGRATGMLASWVQQAAFDPPTLTVAVNKKRYLNDWLAKSPAVVLNLVGATQNKFLKHFGKGFEPDEAAFEGVDTTSAPNGVPALSGAIGWLAGRVTSQLDAGDHTVYLVQLEAATAADDFDEHAPMVHVRKNGFKY